MCLILFSYDVHPDYRLVLAANRDEFYDRPTRPAQFWKDHPSVLAGRDLRGNGTWLGVTRTGRFAAITNYRNPAELMSGAPSRGILVRRFLTGATPPSEYLATVEKDGARYNGFNLLAGDRDGIYYYGNCGGGIRKLAPGISGLSNHLLDTPWPKVEKGKRDLYGQLSGREPMETETIFTALADPTRPPDAALPDTGVGLEWERRLSPLFISSETYGTRSSSILLVARNGIISFFERTFPVPGSDQPAPRTRSETFRVDRIAPPAGRS
jgi:uncharacterized protein with NRDE domain